MRLKRNYYEIMGLSRTSTTQEIKTKYHALARLYHPDRAVDKDTAQRLFAQINLAYRTLVNDSKRAIYDASLDSEAEKAARAQAYNAPGATASYASAYQTPPSRPAPTSPLNSAPSASRMAASQPPPLRPNPQAAKKPTTSPLQRPAAQQADGAQQVDIQKAMDQANVAYFRGDREQALKLCKQVVAAERNNFAAHRLMGDILSDQGRRAEALAAYREALAAQPGNRIVQDKIRQLQAPPVNSSTTRPTVAATPPRTGSLSDKAQDKPSLFRRFIGGPK
jgi:curved DNA-binding protein CbpA